GGENAILQLLGMHAVELHAAHVEIDEHHRIDVVAEPRRANVADAADEQSRTDEQHHRQRALHHEQRDTRARPCIPSRAPALRSSTRLREALDVWKIGARPARMPTITAAPPAKSTVRG